MNLTVCAGLPRTPENGTWYRLIPPIHYASALSSAHAKLATSRWNAGPLLLPSDQFAALYFADSPLVAQFEVGAMLGSPAPGRYIPNPRGSNFITLNVQVILREVVDLTDVINVQSALGTNAQELTGDWTGYIDRGLHTAVSEPTGMAPTQELGKALYEAKAEGFRSISAQVPYQKTLTVFIDNLDRRSSLTFTDSSGSIVHSIP